MSPLHSIRTRSQIDLADLKSFVANALIPFENENRDGQVFNQDLTKKLHAMGYLQTAIPREIGGQGTPVSDLIWILREIAYGSPSVGGTYVGNLLGFSTLALYGQDSLRVEVFGEYLKQYSLWSCAMTEANCGSNLQMIQTTAVETSDGFVINGEKNYITNATYSKHLAVFAKMISQSGKDLGVTCFYVPGSTEGLIRGPVMRKFGWKKANTGTLYFKDAKIEKRNLIGQPGQGLEILAHSLSRSKILLAAMAQGICQRAFDLTTERLINIERFGKPLLEQPSIRHLLARLLTNAEASWLLTCQAAATWDSEQSAIEASSMAKLFAGKVATEIARETMELFGAQGYFLDSEISRLWEDAKGTEIIEGASFVQEILIAKSRWPSRRSSSVKVAEFNKKVA